MRLGGAHFKWGKTYGSMGGYITNGLGLSASTQALLKAKLLG